MITPLRDILLVELRDATASQYGLIAVVHLENPPAVRATVRAVGDEVRELSVGDAVVISRLQGIEIASGTLLIPESAVLATEPPPSHTDLMVSPEAIDAYLNDSEVMQAIAARALALLPAVNAAD